MYAQGEGGIIAGFYGNYIFSTRKYMYLYLGNTFNLKTNVGERVQE